MGCLSKMEIFPEADNSDTIIMALNIQEVRNGVLKELEALNKKDLEQKRAIFFKAKHLLELHYEVQFFMKKADQGLDMSQKQEAMEKDPTWMMLAKKANDARDDYKKLEPNLDAKTIEEMENDLTKNCLVCINP